MEIITISKRCDYHDYGTVYVIQRYSHLITAILCSNAIKSLKVGAKTKTKQKNRVGRVNGNTHIFFPCGHLYINSNVNIYTSSVFCCHKHKKKFDIRFSMKRHETV